MKKLPLNREFKNKEEYLRIFHSFLSFLFKFLIKVFYKTDFVKTICHVTLSYDDCHILEENYGKLMCTNILIHVEVLISMIYQSEIEKVIIWKIIREVQQTF